jgi:BA14K-like protein
MKNSISSVAILALGAMLTVGANSASLAATGMPAPQVYTPPKMQPTPQYYTSPGLSAYYGTRYRSYDPSTNTIQGRNGIRRIPLR